MQSLTFRKAIVIFLCSLSIRTVAQKDLSGFTGNIQIKSSSLIKVLNAFYQYLTNLSSGNFNYSDYYVRIFASSKNDSTEFLEVTLYNKKMTSYEDKPNNFYGYLKKNKIYFIFSNKNKLFKRDVKSPNPKIFKRVKVVYKPPYDPYAWEIVISNDKIIRKDPEGTIDKYIFK